MDGLSEEERQHLLEKGEPLEFSHTLEEQIGGQIEAGFLIAGFYEDVNPPESNELVSIYMPVCLATRAVKPAI
jgi:hypothetical protein